MDGRLTFGPTDGRADGQTNRQSDRKDETFVYTVQTEPHRSHLGAVQGQPVG